MKKLLSSKTILFFAFTALLLSSCGSSFVKARGNKIYKGLFPFTIQGATLMDDLSLWDSSKKDPDMSSIQEKDYAFTALGEINTVRLALKMDYFIDTNGSPKKPGFEFLDRQLDLAKKYNLNVMLDMHIPPGGAIQDYTVTDANRRFWNDETLQNLFVKGWELLAEHCRDNKTVLGYELMNEPAVETDYYQKLMIRTIEAIRKIDKNHLIIIQAAKDWSLIELPDKNILYSFHFYKPLSFTHQGISSDFGQKTSYPGNAYDWDNKIIYYDKDVIINEMKYAADLSEKYDVPAIIGEFGVSTYADEKDIQNWLKDTLDSIKALKLSGYVYWRQIAKGKDDLRQDGKAAFAIINEGDYFSPAQFFGIRPQYARRHDKVNVAKIYREGSIIKND